MALTVQQIQDEQRKEREYNAVFEKVIARTGWGAFYPLMKMASDLLKANLPKRLCIDKNGRPIVVYQGDVAKNLAVWATPTHEVISQNISRGDIWATIGSIFGGGQIQQAVAQYDKDTKCYDISPEEVIEMHSRQSKTNPKDFSPPYINKYGLLEKAPITPEIEETPTPVQQSKIKTAYNNLSPTKKIIVVSSGILIGGTIIALLIKAIARR